MTANKFSDTIAPMADTYMDHVYALIMAGGGGTRLWPLSREHTPKQFLKLFGRKSLIEITAERVRHILPWEKIFVSTATKEYAQTIRKLLPDVPKENIIIEPVRRDSAPAHGLGAVHIFRKDPQAVIINAASDHFITPEKNYKQTMLAAAEAAFGGDWLIAVGITPTYPHTGMGHLKIGKKWAIVGHRQIFKLDKFIEKPALPLAKRYTKSGNYYWNANHYVWRADAFLRSLSIHAPEIYKGLNKIADSIGMRNEASVLEAEYEKMPKISVDYSISEKAKNFLMLIADYSFTDIGDFNELWKNLSKDESGNVIMGGSEGISDLINIDTTDTLIHTNGRMVAIIDVDNIVVVDTPDALLICSRSRAQKVKQIVETLKKTKKNALL